MQRKIAPHAQTFNLAWVNLWQTNTVMLVKVMILIVLPETFGEAFLLCDPTTIKKNLISNTSGLWSYLQETTEKLILKSKQH